MLGTALRKFLPVLGKVGLLPRSQCRLLEAGIRSGQGERIMEQIAGHQLEESEAALEELVSRIEGKNHQIAAAIASGATDGMISMDQSVLKLYGEGRITCQTALAYADNPEQMLRRLG